MNDPSGILNSKFYIQGIPGKLSRNRFIPLLIGVWCIWSLHSHAQVNRVSGTVMDAHSGRALAFVNITYNNTGRGTTSNIDGDFNLQASEPIRLLKFSYIGYQSVEIPVDQAPGDLKVAMQVTTYDIEEIKITPGINPAHRIIKKVFNNRKINNPEKMRSFSYTSYNKFYFTVDVPEIVSDTIQMVGDSAIVEVDSGLVELKKFTDKQHIFLMESVSNRDYKFPDKNHEEVTASRVSGFQDPSFTLLATQIQSFSFYDDFITILNKNYLNPVSAGSTTRYLFILKDTLITETSDTVFIIQYEPKRGRNFEGLKGILYINTNQYAIQNVLAEAAESKDFFRIRIQQKYEFIDSTQWFPVQLNTDVIIKNPGDEDNPENISTEANENEVQLIGVGKSYLTDILLEPELELRKFRHIEVQINQDAHKKEASFWDQYRYAPLSAKDTVTYHVLDSLGREINLDRLLWITETFINGYVPIGFINLDINSIIDYNSYEGLRVGIGGETNDRLSKRFFIGGHVAYGTKDKSVKFGASGRVILSHNLDMDVQVSYLDDVMEPAGYDFYHPDRMFNTESFRRFLIQRKDLVQSWKVGFGFRTLRYTRAQLYLSQSDITYGNDYLYLVNDESPYVFINKGRFTEAGIRFRFAFKETFIQSPRRKISLGTKYPILYGNILHGLEWFEGTNLYTKFETRLTKTFTTKIVGKSQFTIDGGWVIGNVPYSLLYNGKGSYRMFTIEAENSFGTMRMNEFLSDRFMSVFFRQNFGKLLFRTRSFQPEIVFLTHFGIGSLKQPEVHRNIQFKTLEKGYYESGILINNILNQFFLGYGIGVYFRYGPYSLDTPIDNFAFKFTLNARL